VKRKKKHKEKHRQECAPAGVPWHVNYLEKHILVCTDGESCGMQDAEEIRDALKSELKERGLRKRFRDGACSCIGLCKKGVNAVIWPDGIYLGNLTEDDVPRLVDFLEGKGPRLADLETRADEKIKAKLAGD
jgi:(2Fe-2S) ferredoxin